MIVSKMCKNCTEKRAKNFKILLTGIKHMYIIMKLSLKSTAEP